MGGLYNEYLVVVVGGYCIACDFEVALFTNLGEVGFCIRVVTCVPGFGRLWLVLGV